MKHIKLNLANEIKKKKDLPLKMKMRQFILKMYFSRDKNIFKERSMISTGIVSPKDSISTSLSEGSLESIEKLREIKIFKSI